MRNWNRLVRITLCMVLVSASAALAGAPGEFQNLGGLEIGPQHTLVLGGSFGPPTLEHMGLVTRLMERFGFTQGKLWVATPYKVGAAPAEVSLGLTRLAVERADEPLTIQGTPFTEFQSVEGTGQSQWRGRGGRTFSLAAEDYDIRNGIKENALETLRAIHRESGSARSHFWVAGGDSFASVQKWTPAWRELFDHTHWIVVSRPGFENLKNAVRFEENNPLARAFSADFLKQYIYFFDQTNRTHIYQNRDPQKPNIYIVDLPSLNDSSSLHRKSLKDDPEREHAQAGLQPSVFRECVEHGYYSERTTGHFSRQNLETYLKWIFGRVERAHPGELTDDEHADFVALGQDLIQIAEDVAQRGARVPLWRAALAFVFTHAQEYWDEIKDLRHLSKRIREAQKKYGIREFAVAYIALEVVETTVFPVFMYHVAGPMGAVMAPFLHPNEVITIPAYLGWRMWRKRQAQIALSGSVQNHRDAIAARDQMLRGNPSRTLLSKVIPGNLGLGGETITLNIMQSPLPDWIPLAVRKWDDRRMQWFDVNVTTNELAAIIRQPGLVAELKKSSGDQPSLFAALASIAIARDSQARETLNYFVTRRYFATILRPGITPEILSGFTALEQKLIQRLQVESQQVSQRLSESGFKAWRETLGHLYGFLRVSQVTPAMIETVVNGYPGIARPERFNREQSLRLARLHSAWKALPGLRAELAVPYPAGLDADSQLDAQESILRQEIARSVKAHQDLFLAAQMSENDGLTAQAGFRLRPALARLGDTSPQSTPQSNFVWDLAVKRADFLWRWGVLERGVEYAMRYLESRPRAKGVDRAFWKTLDRLDRSREQLFSRIEALEFRWLRTQREGQDAAQDAAQIQTEWRALIQEADALLEQTAQLIRYAEGTAVVDVQNRQEVQKALDALDLVNSTRCAGLLTSAGS